MSRFQKVAYFKGKVKAIDTVLCKIQLETEEVVYWGLCYHANGLFLPNIGDLTVILELHLDTLSNPKEYYIDPKGDILIRPQGCTSPHSYILSDLSHLVNKYNLRIDHLWAFNNLYLYPALEKICTADAGTIKLCLLTGVLQYYNNFRILKVVTCRNLHYLMKGYNYGLENYVNCYQVSEDNECLIGLLQLNIYGLYQLTDGRRKINCLINNSNMQEMMSFNNQIVLIFEYNVVGEIYQQNINYEYLQVDAKYIIKLNLHPIIENSGNFLHNKCPLKYIEKISFKLTNISLPISNERKSMDSWLEIESDGVLSCICVGREYFSTIPLLSIGSYYDLYLKTELKQFKDIEVNRVNPRMFIIQKGSGIFVKQDTVNDDSIIYLTLEQVVDKMNKYPNSATEKYLNFEGVIYCKHFNGIQGSRTKRQIQGMAFGTPGDISHSIRFSSPNSNITFVLYLNNWERKLYQLGLVPNMRVKVRCVEFNNRYLRSNAMTSFTPMGLEIPRALQTCNLNPYNPKVLYGSIGLSYNLTCNVVMRSLVKVLNFRTYSVSVSGDDELSFSTSLYVANQGEALINCKSSDFLRQLLLSSDVDLVNWIELLKGLGPIEIPNYNTVLDTCMDVDARNFLISTLTTQLKMLNMMEIVASVEHIKHKGLPVWQVIQVIGFN